MKEVKKTYSKPQKVKKKKKNLIIPLTTKQKTKNSCYKQLNTDESKALIKPEKKMDIEKIFIKS